MNIISEKEICGRLADGINTLLGLDETSFNEVIKRLKEFEKIDFFYLTDNFRNKQWKIPPEQLGLEQPYSSDRRLIARGYFGGESYTRQEVFSEIEKLSRGLDKKSPVYLRCEKILDAGGKEMYRKLSNARSTPEVVEKVFKAFESEEGLQKFLSSKDDKTNELIMMAVAFDRNVLDWFYFPEIPKWQERYKAIYEKENMDKILIPTYKMTSSKASDSEKLVSENHDWAVNPKLREKILKGMPQDIEPEQQAMYIYCQMTKMFKFNHRYTLRGKEGVEEKFSNEFNKEKMEAITADSEILCFDFSRIYHKLAGEIEGITPVIISQGYDAGHFRTGFFSDKVSVGLEPTNISCEEGVNDLYNAKNGLPLSGINIVSDRGGLINDALEKIYPLVYGSKFKTVEDHMAALKETIKPDVPMDFELRLQSFLEAMKNKGLQGSEAVMELMTAKKAGFWNPEIKFSFIGEQTIANGTKTRNRQVVLSDTEQDNLYLLDPNMMISGQVTANEISRRLQDHNLVYEDDERKIKMKDGKEL